MNSYDAIPFRLYKLTASRNLIKSISLSGHKNIRYLHLDLNQMSYLSKSMFPSQLMHVRLNNNQIKYIEPDAFEGMKFFYLDLSNNELKDIDLNVFRNMDKSLWSKSNWYYAGLNDLDERKWQSDTDKKGGIFLIGNPMTEAVKAKIRDYFLSSLSEWLC